MQKQHKTKFVIQIRWGLSAIEFSREDFDLGSITLVYVVYVVGENIINARLNFKVTYNDHPKVNKQTWITI